MFPLALSVGAKLADQNVARQAEAERICENDRPFGFEDAESRPESKADNCEEVHPRRNRRCVAGFDHLPHLRNETCHGADRSEIADQQCRIQ